MPRPDSVIDSNPAFHLLVERTAGSILRLAKRHNSEAACVLASRLSLAPNLGEIELVLAIALLCERVDQLERARASGE